MSMESMGYMKIRHAAARARHKEKAAGTKVRAAFAATLAGTCPAKARSA
jgi:hypothetical protein